MRLLGKILLFGGLIATAIYGYQAYQDTDQVSILGKDITLSQADWTPVIISGAIAIIGLVILATGRRR